MDLKSCPVQTILSADMTCGLGEIQILHPPGTFALTPASLISVQAIGRHQELLAGNGIDWGSGTGCLAITVVRISQVKRIFGLEITEANVEIARKNAILNGVEDKVTFMLSNSYYPFSNNERELLDSFVGQMNFILANPPASENDDGFGYRRNVLDGARRYLVDGGLVFLNISFQYGMLRIKRLTNEVSRFVYGGLLASTDWVPFDLSRPYLLRCLEQYVQEEYQGGLEYTFANPETLNEKA